MGTHRAMARFYSARRSWRMLWGSAGPQPAFARSPAGARVEAPLPAAASALLLGLSAGRQDPSIGESAVRTLASPRAGGSRSIFWCPPRAFTLETRYAVGCASPFARLPPRDRDHTDLVELAG